LITLDLSPSFFSEQEKNVAAEVRPLLRTGWMQTRYFKTMADEGAALEETGAQTARTGSLGDLPLTVVTATGPIWWPGTPPTIDPAAFRTMWLARQADLTKLSANSRQVFADRSSHFMNFDQPELIVKAIRQMIAANIIESPSLYPSAFSPRRAGQKVRSSSNPSTSAVAAWA